MTAGPLFLFISNIWYLINILLHKNYAPIKYIIFTFNLKKYQLNVLTEIKMRNKIIYNKIII